MTNFENFKFNSNSASGSKIFDFTHLILPPQVSFTLQPKNGSVWEKYCFLRCLSWRGKLWLDNGRPSDVGAPFNYYDRECTRWKLYLVYHNGWYSSPWCKISFKHTKKNPENKQVDKSDPRMKFLNAASIFALLIFVTSGKYSKCHTFVIEFCKFVVRSGHMLLRF